MVDETRARQVVGITDIVKLPEGVGVVGTSVEATQAAKNLLKVTWSDAPGAHLDSERALEWHRATQGAAALRRRMDIPVPHGSIFLAPLLPNTYSGENPSRPPMGRARCVPRRTAE
jgi:hypothetical protein